MSIFGNCSPHVKAAHAHNNYNADIHMHEVLLQTVKDNCSIFNSKRDNAVSLKLFFLWSE